MPQWFVIISRHFAVAYCRVLVVFGLLALCTGFTYVTQVSPSSLPSTAQSLVDVFANFGSVSDVSGRVRIGGTSCAATVWRSNTAMSCRSSNGVAHTRDAILPVIASVQLQRSPSGINDTIAIKCRYIRVSTTFAHNTGGGENGVNKGECIAFSRLFCYDTSGSFPRFFPARLARTLSCTAPVSNVLVAGTNVCAGKAASANSAYFVNGEWNTSYPLLTSTTTPPFGYHSAGCLPAMASWWRVDLGAEFNVTSVVFRPRQDNPTVQSSNLEITFENKVKMASSLLELCTAAADIVTTFVIRTDKRLRRFALQSLPVPPPLFSPLLLRH